MCGCGEFVYLFKGNKMYVISNVTSLFTFAVKYVMSNLTDYIFKVTSQTLTIFSERI